MKWSVSCKPHTSLSHLDPLENKLPGNTGEIVSLQRSVSEPNHTTLAKSSPEELEAQQGSSFNRQCVTASAQRLWIARCISPSTVELRSDKRRTRALRGIEIRGHSVCSSSVKNPPVTSFARELSGELPPRHLEFHSYL